MRWVAIVVVGCTAPRIEIATLEAGVDAPADVADAPAKQCPSLTGPDMKACSGPDEDSDCIPDSCDDCPSVPQVPRTDKPTAGIGALGTACTQPDARYPATKRLFFEPFAKFSAAVWDAPVPYNANDRARMVDGYLRMGETSEPYIRSNIAPGGGAVVVTAVMRFVKGWFAGVMVRMTKEGVGAHTRGYGCLIENTVFRPFYTPVACAPNAGCLRSSFKDAGGAEIRAPLAFTPDDWFVVRASVTRGPTPIVQCQIYPLTDKVEQLLRLAPPNDYTLTASVEGAAPVLAEGEVGVFAAGSTVEVASIDVLSD